MRKRLKDFFQGLELRMVLRWGMCQCQDRQAGEECSAPYEMDKFFVGMDRFSKDLNSSKVEKECIICTSISEGGVNFCAWVWVKVENLEVGGR